MAPLIEIFILLLSLANIIRAQNASSSSSGYSGYNLSSTGDPTSTTYETADTTTNVSTTVPSPDVFLNASVYIGEIDIQVENLTAKINLQAQVLSLLSFNAGVDVSIDRVNLLIQDVTAKVVLEARLENIVIMIGDVLNSLDLNPVLVALGTDLTNITNTTLTALEGGSTNTKRSVPASYDLAHNILYSTNNYQGQTHTNRILTQSGTIVDQYLDNDGNVKGQNLVGSYLKDMSFNGENQTVTVFGQTAQKLEYVYTPFYGLTVVSNIYINSTGSVLATQVLSELSGGGGSSIGN